jgi:hypothetical protein
MQEQLVQRVSVSGYRRLSYHDHAVTGDGEAFGLGNYGGQGDKPFTDFGNVTVTGSQVFNALNFEFVIQDSRFQDPQGQRFSIDYERGPWKANLGDIRGSLLNTNRFATFTKTLRGVSFGYSAGGFSAKTVVSDVKGAPRTVTIQGTNSAGPYYLQSAQIVRGSERIEVDGVPKTLGEDYIINYEIGAITFVNRSTGVATIIPPTSTIVASYEVFGFSGSRGRIDALGMLYNFNDVVSIGLTGMQQVRGGGGGLSTRLEKFQGFGPPSTPYFLQFEPLETEPIVIRVNGILQTEGVDYFFDDENPSIFFFTRFMPATDNIDVLYTPKPTSTVDGDRQIVGWDVSFPLGPSGSAGSLRYSEATGRLMNTPTPTSGTARGIDFRYGVGGLAFIASLRRVPAGYVNIETTGFNRNEDAVDYDLTWRPSGLFNYGLNYTNAAITSRTVDSGGNVTLLNNRFTKARASIGYGASSAMPWTLGFSKTQSRNPQGETQVSTTDLTTARTGSNWTWSMGLQHQDARGPVTDGSGTTVKSLSLDTLNLRGAYQPSPVWNLSLSTGLSQVRSEGEEGLGRDVQAALQWKPNQAFDATLSVQDSDAGQLATFGFNNGYGLGYNGNGFSGGTGQSGLLSASKVRAYTLRGTWSPSSALSFNARGYTRLTEGSFSSNTRTDGVGFDASWLLNDHTNLQGSIDTSRTDFIGTPLTSANTVFSGYLDWGPPGPWSWHSGFTFFVSSGASGFDQTSSSLDAALGYRLSERQSLGLNLYQTSSTGQFAQDDFDLSVAYRYQLWRTVALQASYRFRDVVNKDPLATSGAYSSRGFDVELVFNFGS